MGSLCEKHSSSVAIETSPQKPREKDVSLPAYTSAIDKDVELIENNYMFLKQVPFEDYVYSLSKFSMNNATLKDDYTEKIANFSSKDPWFNEEMSEDNFQVFIDNKIVKHPAIYNKLAGDETKCSIFKDIMIKLYKKLNDKIKRGNENFVFAKEHALIPGLLFCKSDNNTKIKFLFDLFSENSKFVKTSDFSDFQYAIYLAASYVILAIRVDLSGNYNEFVELDNNRIKTLLDACQEKDCKHLVEVIDSKFFTAEGTTEYYLQDFKGLFMKSNKDENFGFILTTKGIRHFLELNNV